MSLQVQRINTALKENVSKHPGYREIGEAVHYRAGSKRFTVGEEKGQFINIPTDSKLVLDLKLKQEKEKSVTNPLEKALLGWGSEYLQDRQAYVEETAKSKVENRAPRYNEIITAEHFSTIKSLPRVVMLVSMEQTKPHQLLNAIRVEGTDDLNGLKILDIQNIGDDILQLQGEFTVPRDIPALDILSYTLDQKRWGFRTAFSYELASVRLDIQNIDQILLNALAGKIELRRNKDVAAIINAVGNSGSMGNWNTLTATDHFANYAYDDIKELIKLIDDLEAGYDTEFIGMHPDVYTSFFRNMSTTGQMGVQLWQSPPFTQTPTSEMGTFSSFPGRNFLQDNLLTATRVFAWNRNAVWQAYGGIRTVPFENREVGYYGTNTRTYFNSALIRADLLVGATGIV